MDHTKKDAILDVFNAFSNFFEKFKFELTFLNKINNKEYFINFDILEICFYFSSLTTNTRR